MKGVIAMPRDETGKLLEIEGLGFRAGGRVILHDLDLALGKGEIHALLGGNGAGKSTLGYLIMGCVGCGEHEGSIRFDGRLIDDLPMHERARLGITLGWQEPARFEGVTVRSYLSLGGEIADPADSLEQVGLVAEDYLDRPLDKTLSGGERKRIELASVLAFKPRLAILDEPASGIDLLSIDEIAAVIERLKQDGATVLLITHRQEMARIADHASHLCDGHIIFTGTAEEVAQRFKSRPCRVCNGEVCHEQNK